MFWPFFSKRQIPARQFEKCSLSVLGTHLADRGAVRTELDAMERLETMPEAHREKLCAHWYFRLEEYLSKEQPKNRVPVETLREHIFRSCKADRAEGNFALLFVPASLREVKLFEQFTEAILKKSQLLLGEEAYRALIHTFLTDDRLKSVMKNGHLSSALLEAISRKRGETQRGAFVKSFLQRVVEACFQSLAGAHGTMRAELAFQEVYHEFRDQLDFLDDISKVLLLVPEEVLEEEKIELKPKLELKEEVVRRNRELEMALAELKAEKGKLANALQDLRVSNQAKSDFITVVSHQFRTPLSVIRWQTEVFENEITGLTAGKKDEWRGYLRAIDEKSSFLINILNDIFDVLAIEGGEVKLEKKPNQLWEIAGEVVKDFEKEATQKGITLLFDRARASLKEIALDQSKIRRILEILVRNALAYTPEEGKVTITIGEGEQQGTAALTCTVSDTGIGIAAEDIPQLFTKFFRTKNAISRHPDGAGLGLYLVKHFVEAHHGSVSVESALKKGSSFAFTLPVK